MAKLSESVKEFINVAGLTAKIKALEAELSVLKALQSSLGVKTRGRKPGNQKAAKAQKAKGSKRGPHGKVKETVIAYLEKHKEAKSSTIAKESGLKKGSINQVLFALKKDGTVTQDKKRGSPFVWAKK